MYCLFAWLVHFSGTCLCAAEVAKAWPKNRIVALQVSDFSEMQDGMKVSYVQLNSPSLKLRWFAGGDWLLSDGRHAEASAEFYHRTFTHLRFQLYVFSPGGWLQDLSTSSEATYLQSLVGQYPRLKVELLNAGDFTPSLGSPSFLGGTFRCFQYRVLPEVESQSSLTVTDYITVTADGFCVVARFSGDAEVMERMAVSCERELPDFLRE